MLGSKSRLKACFHDHHQKIGDHCWQQRNWASRPKRTFGFWRNCLWQNTCSDHRRRWSWSAVSLTSVLQSARVCEKLWYSWPVATRMSQDKHFSYSRNGTSTYIYCCFLLRLYVLASFWSPWLLLEVEVRMIAIVIAQRVCARFRVFSLHCCYCMRFVYYRLQFSTLWDPGLTLDINC